MLLLKLFHLVLLANSIVQVLEVVNKVSSDLLLLLGHSLLLHLTSPVLGVGLSRPMVADLGHVGTLLDCILAEEFEVSLLLQLVSVAGDGLLLGDHSDALVAIQSLVGDLRLEREALQLSEVDVFHF